MKKIQSVKSLSLICSKPMELLLFREGSAFSFSNMIWRRVNPLYTSIKSDTVQFFLHHKFINNILEHHTHIFNLKSYSYNSKNSLEFLEKSLETKASIPTFLRTLVTNTSKHSFDLNNHQFKIFNYHTRPFISSSFSLKEKTITQIHNIFNQHSNNTQHQKHSHIEQNKEEETYVEEKKTSQTKNIFNHFNTYLAHSTSLEKKQIFIEKHNKNFEHNQTYVETIKTHQRKNIFNHSTMHTPPIFSQKEQIYIHNRNKNSEHNKTYVEEKKASQRKNIMNQFHNNLTQHSISKYYLHDVNHRVINNTTDNTRVEIIYKKEQIKQEKHASTPSNNLQMEEKNYISSPLSIVNGIVSSNQHKENIESIVNHVETNMIQKVSDDVITKIEARWNREIMRRGGNYDG